MSEIDAVEIDAVEIDGFLNTNMNNIYREEGRCFLSAIGNYCGSNSDNGEGCTKSVPDLELIWKAKFLEKNLPIPERKTPYLFVNEKLGRGLHRSVDGIFEYCGNVNYFCKSCNMIYSRRTGDVQENEIANAGFQARKSHEVRPLLKNKIVRYLVNNTHVCKKIVTHNWSDDDEFKCSPQLMIDTLEQIRNKTISYIYIIDYGIKCPSEICDGIHIIIFGEPPMPSVSKQDLDAFIKEIVPAK